MGSYFLYVGRFIEAKNLLFLLQAFTRYRELVGEEGWELVLVGSGRQEGTMRDWVARKRVPGVRFAGIRQPWELPEFYAFASCLVLPSISEPWGLVVNEAMACGVPVLVSDKCGCAEDLVEQGGNGFLFDPSEVEGLARMFAKVSSGSMDLSAMGRRGCEKVAKFTVDRYAEETVRHISSLFEMRDPFPRPRWLA
jgi:1,2-diacylglycerol 3-alpha-glucosyltransferase